MDAHSGRDGKNFPGKGGGGIKYHFMRHQKRIHYEGKGVGGAAQGVGSTDMNLGSSGSSQL